MGSKHQLEAGEETQTAKPDEERDQEVIRILQRMLRTLSILEWVVRESSGESKGDVGGEMPN